MNRIKKKKLYYIYNLNIILNKAYQMVETIGLVGAYATRI